MHVTLLTAALLILAPAFVSAHQPNYIGSESQILIPDANISRAYYGELTGSPAEYRISLSENTDFYVNLLAPDISGARTDFILVMRDADNNTVLELKNEKAWEKWREEFAGDTYLKGPEIRTQIPKGDYTIVVSNPDNQGKYVLAPGEDEIFTAGGIPDTIGQIYQIKTSFFGKPWYSIFGGIIGKMLLVGTLIVVFVIVFILYRVVWRDARSSMG